MFFFLLLNHYVHDAHSLFKYGGGGGLRARAKKSRVDFLKKVTSKILCRILEYLMDTRIQANATSCKVYSFFVTRNMDAQASGKSSGGVCHVRAITNDS